MKLRVLLINPWIYDFSAYNLWARPLGLYKVAEYLSSFDVELSLIDCMECSDSKIFCTGKYRFEAVPKPAILEGFKGKFKRYGMSVADFRLKLGKSGLADIVIMTSVMAYWYPGVQSCISIIREEMGDIPIILGGIYATLYHDHASRNSGADFVYRGEVSQALKFAISTFGFKLKMKGPMHSYYDIFRDMNSQYSPLLTSSGCPFRCSYCASQLLSDFKQRSPDAVFSEIISLHSRGVEDMAFYDDALLIDADNHIKPILRGVIDAGLDIRFHTPNGLHAALIDHEIAALMKKSGFQTLRLSLETVNTGRQTASGGKVRNSDLVRAIDALMDTGFRNRQVGVYVMIGLPKQDIREVRESIEFVKQIGARICLTEFSPIRGTRSWDELIAAGIINDDLDPILTNNSVFTFLLSDYAINEIQKIKLDVKEYNLQYTSCFQKDIMYQALEN